MYLVKSSGNGTLVEKHQRHPDHILFAKTMTLAHSLEQDDVWWLLCPFNIDDSLKSSWGTFFSSDIKAADYSWEKSLESLWILELFCSNSLFDTEDPEDTEIRGLRRPLHNLHFFLLQPMRERLGLVLSECFLFVDPGPMRVNFPPVFPPVASSVPAWWHNTFLPLPPHRASWNSHTTLFGKPCMSAEVICGFF